MKKAFVIFDRDGTLIEHVHHLTDPDLVQFKPDLQTSLQMLEKAGYRFGIITNQSVVGRGLATISDIQKVNKRIFRLWVNILNLYVPSYSIVSY